MSEVTREYKKLAYQRQYRSGFNSSRQNTIEQIEMARTCFDEVRDRGIKSRMYIEGKW